MFILSDFYTVYLLIIKLDTNDTFDVRDVIDFTRTHTDLLWISAYNNYFCRKNKEYVNFYAFKYPILNEYHPNWHLSQRSWWKRKPAVVKHPFFKIFFGRDKRVHSNGTAAQLCVKVDAFFIFISARKVISPTTLRSN